MSEDEKVLEIESRLVKDANDLIVYKKAFSSSIAIHKASLGFPKIEQYALADQIRRASKSICANIAEGFGKQNYSVAEFARFLAMAEASVVEVQVWLHYAFELEYIDSSQFTQWNQDYKAIKIMLYKLRKSL
jgi:four helix bundle protein